MIFNQETLNLSPYMALYDLIVPKDNTASRFIWHGNTRCHNDICSKLETHIEVIKRNALYQYLTSFFP